MASITEYSTVIEMFNKITEKFRNDIRPMLMHKIEGKYVNISFKDVSEAVEIFALGLAAIGIKRGDHVAIISENRPEWVIADMAIMKLGAVNISIYPTLTPKQVEFILNDAEVKVAIASNQLQLNKIIKIFNDVPTLKRAVVLSDKVITQEKRVMNYSLVMEMGKEFGNLYPGYVKQEENKIKPEDLMTLIYTSGTTGNPKGVMLTHHNLVSNMKAAASVIHFGSEDIILSFLPLSHSYERLAGYYTAMSCGSTIAYAESIDTLRDNLLEVKPTVVTTVPRLFERLYNRIMKQMSEESKLKQKIFNWAINIGKTYRYAKKNNVSVGSLSLQHRIADKLVFKKIRERTGGRIKFFASGGAALAPELGEFFDAIGITVIEGYGMTESSPVISVNLLENYKFGTVGPPLPGVQVKIADDGEILAKGPNVMVGYWKNPEATREAIDDEGWLHTGDIGHLDSDGYLKITDRKKHLFVSSGGKNIAPQHIEGLFLQSSYVEQVVLIGDGRMYLTALVVPSFDMLRDYAKKHHLKLTSNEDLANHPDIYKMFEGEIAKFQKDLANYEKVRKFTILSEPLTIENDELTPTMKVKRRVVEAKFRDLIEKMYADVV
ncbi:MAG: long-chain fatty acid--CoA ligase [Ignavibacteriales bacterium]|nr:long-chain fatty acid--CoA ligase [Ignavibacteriales bacterium]